MNQDPPINNIPTAESITQAIITNLDIPPTSNENSNSKSDFENGKSNLAIFTLYGCVIVALTMAK